MRFGAGWIVFGSEQSCGEKDGSERRGNNLESQLHRRMLDGGRPARNSAVRCVGGSSCGRFQPAELLVKALRAEVRHLGHGIREIEFTSQQSTAEAEMKAIREGDACRVSLKTPPLQLSCLEQQITASKAGVNPSSQSLGISTKASDKVMKRERRELKAKWIKGQVISSHNP